MRARALLHGCLLAWPLLADAADPMQPLAAGADAGAGAGAGSAAASGALRAAAPPSSAAARAGAPLLAIREDGPQQRRALFGERWVRVGDRLEGGATVVAIETLAVHLLAPGGRRSQVLHLLPPLQYTTPAPAEARPWP